MLRDAMRCCVMLSDDTKCYAMLSNAKQCLVMLHLASIWLAKDLKLFFYERQTTQQHNTTTKEIPRRLRASARAALKRGKSKADNAQWSCWTWKRVQEISLVCQSLTCFFFIAIPKISIVCSDSSNPILYIWRKLFFIWISIFTNTQIQGLYIH